MEDHLESAAFLFHIEAIGSESSGQRELRVLLPLQDCNGFWLALFS
jgi:hypothetical protein